MNRAPETFQRMHEAEIRRVIEAVLAEAKPQEVRTASSELAELRRLLESVRIVEERPAETLVPKLWSAPSLAQRFDVHRLTIYRAHRAGRLPGYRVLGCLRFLEEDVRRLLREEGLQV